MINAETLIIAKIYGIGHISFLITALSLFGVLIYFVVTKFNERQKYLVVKILSGVLLFFAIGCRVAIAAANHQIKYIIPDSYCATTGIVLGLAGLLGKKDNMFLHCVVYLGFLGGVLTIFYPDFLGQEPTIFGSRNFTCLIYHMLMVVVSVIMILTKYFVPNIKKWYYLLFGFCTYITHGVFVLTFEISEYAMYINEPILPGTPLYWYLLAPLGGIIYFIFMGIWYLVKYLKNKPTVRN